jgi:hypothetical protein
VVLHWSNVLEKPYFEKSGVLNGKLKENENGRKTKTGTGAGTRIGAGRRTGAGTGNVFDPSTSRYTVLVTDLTILVSVYLVPVAPPVGDVVADPGFLPSRFARCDSRASRRLLGA